MPRVPEILVFSGPGLSVSVTDRASTGGPPAWPGLPLAGHVRTSVSRLARVHSSGRVSGLGTRSVCVGGGGHTQVLLCAAQAEAETPP